MGFGDQLVELIEALDQGPNREPWLIVGSFLNPHDIAVYGFFSAHAPGQFDFFVDGTVPTIPEPPTFDEQLIANKKPICQESYRRTYGLALQPIINTAYYRQLYYQLQKNVDQQMLRVFTALQRSRFGDDTIVIFFSDHGELLGAHGKLHQKWYCAYEEVVHIPFIIHSKRLFRGRQSLDMLTSHVDLLPTMLGLAGIDANEVGNILRHDHTEVHPLVGRDLSPLLFGRHLASRAWEPIYFMTDDDVTKGLNQNNWFGWQYNSVIQPNHIETVVAALRTSTGVEIWKYSRYFDNTQFWTNPGVQDDVELEFGPQTPGWAGITAQVCATKTKTTPVPEEYELYNLTADPLELSNVSGNPSYLEQEQFMANLLVQQRSQKRLTPTVS